MQYIKFQLGCLIIVLYVVVGYVRETVKKDGDAQVSCNPIFDLLLVFAPWAIFFDGVTAYTVNYLNVIPVFVNQILHLLFFLMMNGVIVTTFLYFYEMTIGLPQKKSQLVITLLPAMILTLIIIAYIKDIRFLEGEITNYSMGVSAIACYASLILHYGHILLQVLLHHRTLEKRKKLSVISFIVICGICLVVQIFVPQILLTAIYPTLMVVGIYINFENPSMIRLQKNNRELVSAFATMVENRDGSTGGHIKRTREYVSIILQEMGKKKKYGDLISKDYCENVKNAAPLHDVGKIATPDEILLKPGKLTVEEFTIMKEHAAKGGEIIEKSFSRMENPYFEKIAYEVARYHHEKWNGKGYPDGLSGEAIPLHARIMAIADVFDAVSETRCYRKAMPLNQCFQIIADGAGQDFDPELVAIFLSAREQVEEKYDAINAEIAEQNHAKAV